MTSTLKKIFGIPAQHQIHRWIRLQQAMNRKRWFELDVEKNGPLSLWDFRFPEDAETVQRQDGKNDSVGGKWRLLDDSIIGGYSKANLQLIQSPQDFKSLIRIGEEISMASEEQQSVSDHNKDPIADDATAGNLDEENDNKNSSSFVPFVRWEGTLDTRVNKERQQSQNVQRSGFCSIISPEFPVMDLGGRYNGLEIMCRSDGRPYSLNLKVESYIPDDLYQCFINIPATPAVAKDDESTEESFDRVVLLFQHFVVTAGGRMRATQRELDNRIKIQSIGLTLMDGVDGPFCLDLARIRAVNYDACGVVGEVD
jgi:Complex I intermediate-associated protein 30 (CIA30)